MGIVEQYLSQLNTSKRHFRRSVTFLTALSLLVVSVVFWNLRQTGVAIANDACCGLEEHQHTEECIPEKALICGFDVEVPEETSAEQQPDAHIHGDECYEVTYGCETEEHIHEISCYSDTTADLEDRAAWEASIPELTGSICEDIVLVAQSQVGCGESSLNFELAEDGESRNGITRYGQWYGNPYGAWANMFTSFCLHYAGLTDAPIHSGAEKMQQDWQALDLYRHAGGYEPMSGDIVFLDKNQNGTPETTAIVVRYFDFVLTVIEGDVDNAVVQTEYPIDDPMIVGYGITDAANRLMMFAAEDRSSAVIGETTNYPNTAGTFILYATVGGASYAIDGDGNAVPIQISGGEILADIADPTTLYWEFSGSKNAYTIQNASTGKYLYPRNGALLSDSSQSLTLTGSGTGATIRGGSRNNYYYVQCSETGFSSATSGAVIYFGETPTHYSLWLDGTNGNIMSYRGSNDVKYTVYEGAEMQLPSTWKSPTKYHYKLAGWINIETGEYFAPGDAISITKDTVLYADWVADTYDIGEFNSMVADTVSTKDFITTRVFDYSSLINLHSSKVTVNVSASDHSESWSHVASGNVTYKGQETLDFSFNDHDSSGAITNLNSLNSANKYTGGTAVYSGIYTDELGEALFSVDNLFDPETGTGVVGKHYLGEGDYLFQINNDPSSEYYGYYYYDADLNAASYNQSAQRFYVYDYLEKASDSGSNDYSDFLPLNSVYANNNGQTVKTYSHNGMTNYSFESRYESNSNAKANLWFGMRVDVQFGLPEKPGEVGADGVNGNKDVYGNDMHFHFTGDDDVWILVDGEVVLDLGGIHQAAEGDINFATGDIHVNGKDAGKLSGIEAGEHTLSILYLERGSSMSNCAIYFNLAPRFALTLQKEDVLSQKLLDGAVFEVFHDEACKVPCELWPSRQAYSNGEQPTNTFTIVNGQAYIWGLNPSSTYYIREKAPPNNDPNASSGAPVYERAKGIIRLTLDKKGLYNTVILEEVDASGNKVPVTPGFTVHGFRIDEERQAAYISITNAKTWVERTTSVYVEKVWGDSENHNADTVTAYLNITEPNGTVRRIREIQLSEENGWKYEWTNLPKYALSEDGVTESDVAIKYSVSEAHVPGYMAQITKLESGTYTEETWVPAETFQEDKIYLLKTKDGYLAATGEDKNTLTFVESLDSAKASPLALWTAEVGDKQVKLTNQGTGDCLTYYKSGNTRYFYLSADSTKTQTLSISNVDGGFRLSVKDGTRSYYVGDINNRSYLQATSTAGSALTISPVVKSTTTVTVNIKGYGYSIKNIPLDTETALTVKKVWDHPTNDVSLYEQAQVTFKLFRNGVDTGGTQTVSLKNDWTAVFEGLPYMDETGEPYVYTVVEDWTSDDWTPSYGEVKQTDGEIPTYEITVTNRYRWADAFELPSTGGVGYPLLILIGLLLVVAPFVYGFHLRRKYGRRSRE